MTVKILELRALKENLVKMAANVEVAIRYAVNALVERDDGLAEMVKGKIIRHTLPDQI